MNHNTKKTTRKKILLSGISLIMLAMLFLLLRPIFSGSPTVDSGIVKVTSLFKEHRAEVWTVRFSPDGQLLASCSVDSTIIIRNRATGAVIKTIRQPQGITAIDFSPGGKQLVSSSYDGIVRIWNIDGRLEKTFTGSRGTVWTVAFSPTGNCIASSGDDAVIRIWDISSGKITSELTGHRLNVWIVKFNPDGNSLASGSFDNVIKIWNVADGTCINDIKGHTEAVVDLAFTHDGKRLASSSDDKTIRIWNVEGGNFIKEFSVKEHIQALAFSPDDKRLMSGGRDQDQLGELIQNFTGDSRRYKGVSARLWDVSTGKILQTFSEHANDVNDVAYSPDGLWIATASADGTVGLWEVMK